MDFNLISLSHVDDPFDVYEAFVLHTQGSPEEQVECWKQHLGVHEHLDVCLNIALAIREYCNNKREIDAKISELWDKVVLGAPNGVPDSTSILDLT